MSLGPWYTNIAKSDLSTGYTGVQNVSSAGSVFLLKNTKVVRSVTLTVHLPLCGVQVSAYQPRRH